MSLANQVLKEAYRKGYRATVDGKIISPSGRELKLSKQRNGYLVFGIRYKGITKCVFAHRFQAYCKYGEDLFRAECVRHLDDDKCNNAYENIAIGTESENYQDRHHSWRKEFALKGAKNRRKLNHEIVKGIREEISKGIPLAHIARKHGVARTTIQQIKDGKTYEN